MDIKTIIAATCFFIIGFCLIHYFLWDNPEPKVDIPTSMVSRIPSQKANNP